MNRDKLTHLMVGIFAVILTALVLLLCGSCTPQKLNAYHCKRCKTVDSVSTTTTTSHSEITKVDSVYIPIPADSAWLKAYIDCVQDSSKKFVPVITYIEREQTNRTRVNVALTGRNLKVDCKTLEDTILQLNTTIHTKDSILQSLYERKEKPCPETSLTWWQKFKIDYGGYALGIIALFLLYLLIRLGWFIFKLTPYGAAFNVPSMLQRFVR